ncbi:MAG TPA: ABC transporter permease [Dehalococcoidia bacterium]|nr:ABC transporter permease [Dehalococcoidia bacterium]
MVARVARALVFYAALVGVWQALAVFGPWPSYLFPSPRSVLRSLWVDLQAGVLLEATAMSLRRLAVGYLMASGLGSVIGAATATWRWARDTVGSLVLGLQSLPSITWLPLAVLWFGLSERAIMFVTVMGSLFAISISIRSGVETVPPVLKRAALTLGARPWQLLLHVVLPAIIPSVMQGLKLGWSFAWRSLMAGELLVVSMSLGHLLNVGRDLNDVSRVAAVMLVIVAVGITVDRLLFGQAERVVRERWGLEEAAG